MMFHLRSILFVAIISFSLCDGSVVTRQDEEQLNDTPIIGVLAQEISYHLNGKWPDVFKSMIAASYVKFIEGGGGRVVPLWLVIFNYFI